MAASLAEHCVCNIWYGTCINFNSLKYMYTQLLYTVYSAVVHVLIKMHANLEN